MNRPVGIVRYKEANVPDAGSETVADLVARMEHMSDEELASYAKDKRKGLPKIVEDEQARRASVGR